MSELRRGWRAVAGAVALLMSMGCGSTTGGGDAGSGAPAPSANQPPIVEALSADPGGGPAPLTVKLSFRASDPDGDSLTCSLDVGADGTSELLLPDCRGDRSKVVTLSTPGQVPVALKLTDQHGLSSTRTLVVAVGPRGPVGDLRLARAEWGQTVVSSSPRLVAGKSAMLRLYVLASQPDVTGVAVRAEGFRAGALLGSVVLQGPVAPPTAEDPSSLEQQWWGTVPESWVAPGLEIRAAVDPDNDLQETNESNNDLTLRPDVGAATVLHLTAVPMVVNGSAGKPIPIEPVVTRLWPIRAVDTTVRAPYTYAGSVDPLQDHLFWSSALGELAAVRQADGSQRYYFGFLAPIGTSVIGGIGYIGTPVALGRDNSALTAVHELGHNMGRPHAPCGGAAYPDQLYPYPGAHLGSWGFDGEAGALITPDERTDVMGYCEPIWVSDYNYLKVQAHLEANPPQSAVARPPLAPMRLLAGRVRGGEATLLPLFSILARPAPARAGSHLVRLSWADGAVTEHAFEPEQVADLPMPEAHFQLLVPDRGVLWSVEVVAGGRHLARGSAPARPPAPRRPVAWRDDEGRLSLDWDAAVYPFGAVAHLGQERTTLALGLSGGHAVVRTDGLPRGGAFEVSLSDGVNGVRTVLER